MAPWEHSESTSQAKHCSVYYSIDKLYEIELKLKDDLIHCPFWMQAVTWSFISAHHTQQQQQ